MRTTVTGEPLKAEDACKDNAGFWSRPCPSCQKQKALTPEIAAIYGLPVGAKARLPRFTPSEEPRLLGGRKR
jgi:hypothetical protein